MKKQKVHFPPPVDYSKLAGVKRGRLTFVKLVGKVAGQDSRWVLKCDCGDVIERRVASIYYGRVQSCGCLKTDKLVERNTKHGDCASPEWRAWYNLFARQIRIRSGKAVGSGYTICREWRKSYDNFLQDMGRRPHPKARLRRIDLNKGYSKSNCYWLYPGPKANI